MEILDHEMIQIHQEFIRHEASLQLALKQSGIANLPLTDQVLPALGDLLCRLGNRLKERSYRKLTPEEASAPTFLIML